MIDADYLARTYPGWASRDAEADVVAQAFLQFGVPVLAALNEQLCFNADYFRETRPAWEGVDDAACYRAWLFDCDAQEPCSPPAHLAGLGLPLTKFPEAFPWQAYARMRPQAGAHRWAALDDFFEAGFEAIGEEIPYGQGASGFLLLVARSFSGQRDRLSIRAFELAGSYGVSPPSARQHLADAYLRERRWGVAREAYAALLRDGVGDVWTVRNLVQACSRLKDWDGAASAIADSRARMGADPLWRRTEQELVAQAFEAALTQARARYAENRRPAGDAVLADAVARSVDWAGAVSRQRRAARRMWNRNGLVLLLAHDNDATKSAYRVDDKIRLLDALGRPWRRFGLGQLAEFEAALPDAEVTILFELTARPDLLRAALTARAHGVATVYEADEPLFDAAYAPAPLDSFNGFLSPSLHDEAKLEPPLAHALASVCDAGLAPSLSVAARLAPLVRSRRAFTLPDGLCDPVTPPPARLDGPAVLFLRSSRFLFLRCEVGTFGGALLDVLRPDINLRLVLSGYVKTDSAFDSLGERLTHLGPSETLAGYGPALGGAVVNLALPAIPGDDTALVRSWLEAAAVGVPSLIAGLPDLDPDIQPGQTAWIAVTPDEWSSGLRSLVADPHLRRTLGDAACAQASGRRLAALATRFEQALRTVTRRRRPWT